MPASQVEFDRVLQTVVQNGNCSGCGACALIDDGVAMTLDDLGYNRPKRLLPLRSISLDPVAELKQTCPGLCVKRPQTETSESASSFEPSMGHAVSSWQAWASDDETRHRGSSGGVLTALSTWMIEAGLATQVVSAVADPSSPERTVQADLRAGQDLLSQAGSRYAPVSIAQSSLSLSPSSVVVGKPCEVAALRSLSTARRQTERPVLMSFFCAGVPSQFATERLLRELGIPEGSTISTMRYRGYGWPGDFYAETDDGVVASTTYDKSWGEVLGPSMQWRCKICPDGVGESADIVAGDFWKTDAKGYPVFTDSSGVSALIARTSRGHALIMAAISEGIIGAEPLELRHISAIQPLQVDRRATLLARLSGRKAAGWAIPSYRGFELGRLGLKNPMRSLRYFYGSFRRSWMERRRAN
ncbi:Coenzyme F420 hydrogenase/dehydrogenase, beta subunit C-terminal domain [Paenarthrobacter nitroguajacolicus]